MQLVAGSHSGRGVSAISMAFSFEGWYDGCFTAGTLVWTTAGAMPIEDVPQGEVVVTINEQTGETVTGEVVRRIVTDNAAVLRLWVASADGVIEPINTTHEHPFWVDGQCWTRADHLKPGDELRTVDASVILLSLEFPSERTTVYNFSIAPTQTYLVGEDRVLVHNCFGFVDNLTDGVVTKPYHNWAKMFGGRTPRLDEVRAMIMDVAENGMPVADSLQKHGDQGYSQVFEGVKDGFTVWAEVFYRSDAGEALVRSAGVR